MASLFLSCSLLSNASAVWLGAPKRAICLSQCSASIKRSAAAASSASCRASFCEFGWKRNSIARRSRSEVETSGWFRCCRNSPTLFDIRDCSAVDSRSQTDSNWRASQASTSTVIRSSSNRLITPVEEAVVSARSCSKASTGRFSSSSDSTLSCRRWSLNADSSTPIVSNNGSTWSSSASARSGCDLIWPAAACMSSVRID